jgi:hypothetical protein
MDLTRFDLARNNDLKSLRALLADEQRSGFGSGHAPVYATVMPNPDHLRIRYVEVEAGHAKVSAIFQFREPLVRNMEAARSGHGKNTTGMVILPAKAGNSRTQNDRDILLRGEVDEDGHAMFDAGWRCNCEPRARVPSAKDHSNPRLTRSLAAS